LLNKKRNQAANENWDIMVKLTYIQRQVFSIIPLPC
jgi:hypothetical protein